MAEIKEKQGKEKISEFEKKRLKLQEILGIEQKPVSEVISVSEISMTDIKSIDEIKNMYAEVNKTLQEIVLWADNNNRELGVKLNTIHKYTFLEKLLSKLGSWGEAIAQRRYSARVKKQSLLKNVELFLEYLQLAVQTLENASKDVEQNIKQTRQNEQKLLQRKEQAQKCLDTSIATLQAEKKRLEEVMGKYDSLEDSPEKVQVELLLTQVKQKISDYELEVGKYAAQKEAAERNKEYAEKLELIMTELKKQLIMQMNRLGAIYESAGQNMQKAAETLMQTKLGLYAHELGEKTERMMEQMLDAAGEGVKTLSAVTEKTFETPMYSPELLAKAQKNAELSREILQRTIYKIIERNEAEKAALEVPKAQ